MTVARSAYNTIREWLETLYGRSPGYWALTAFRNGRPAKTVWYGTDGGSLDRAARTIERAEGLDIYASVATHREPAEGKRRGSLSTVVSIPGLWADLDIGTEGHKPAALPNPETPDEALSIVDSLPEPSAVIHSGGGLQVWWMFDEPWVFDDPADAARVSEDWQRRLVDAGQAKGFHVDSLGDLPRILRVPGSENHKLDEARPVVLQRREGPRYTTGELAALGIPGEEREAREPGEHTDDFPYSWAEILEPHGWHSYTDGLWWRPGKTRSEGHSATTDAYGVPVMVNFSASSGLPTGPGQRLTKLRVYAHLNFGGDVAAARKSLARLVQETPEKVREIAERFSGNRVVWSDFWTDEFPEPEWLCYPFVERGRQVAFYSEGKAGKSLLWSEIVAKASAGLPVLGNQAAEPISVLYVDFENLRVDLRERLWKMGLHGEDFPNLHYYTFPTMNYFDTPEGGRELLALALYHKADLVVIDTVSRVIEGGENDPDTFLKFYTHTGLRLKQANIALVRLDHSGKDISKGMRGGSSKITDVDEVWQLIRVGDTLHLTRTHTRSYHGESEVVILRRDEDDEGNAKLHHVIDRPGGDDFIQEDD